MSPLEKTASLVVKIYGTQFTCFYWYQSTNTDAAGATEVRQKLDEMTRELRGPERVEDAGASRFYSSVYLLH
jgi:hypothetical protein